jgi:hypothetical protein
MKSTRTPSRGYRPILLAKKEGALRGRRPLRGGDTGFAYYLPMVGLKILFWRPTEHLPEGGIHVTK